MIWLAIGIYVMIGTGATCRSVREIKKVVERRQGELSVFDRWGLPIFTGLLIGVFWPVMVGARIAEDF